MVGEGSWEDLIVTVGGFDALCTSLVPRPKTTTNTTTQNITPTTTNATLLNPPQHHHTHHSAIDRLYPCFHAESSLSFPVPLLPRPPTREVSAPLFLWLFPFTNHHGLVNNEENRFPSSQQWVKGPLPLGIIFAGEKTVYCWDIQYPSLTITNH